MILKRISIFFAITLFAFYFIPFIALFNFIDIKNLLSIISSERVLFSARLSFVTAFVATILILIITIPSAYALSRYEFRGKKFVDAILELPMIVSPIALGAIFLIFFNTGAGHAIQERFDITFSFYAIILAQFATSAGIATRTIKEAFDSIPSRYESVARSLGASQLKSFFTVTLPIARRGIITAAIITFAKSIGEFGATITLAGAMPMKTETLSISIYLKLASADIEGAAVSIIILLFVGIFFLFVSKYFAFKNET